MDNIYRSITKNVEHDLFTGKVVIIAGARQVGKTTLVTELLNSFDNTRVIKFNGDNSTDRIKLENRDLDSLVNLIGDADLIIVDEAQKVSTIGNTLKLLVDHYGDAKQIVATGSSSLNLLTNTQEPLTGRKYVYELFGLSLNEILSHSNKLEVERQLPDLLVYGTYPAVYTSSGAERERILKELTSSYLYQDILELEQVRNPSVLDKLLAAIALQLGSLVSLNELSQMTGLDLKTVERYIDLLEKNYVIFRLPPFYSNERKSLSKLNKIYFYDLGIRNALINNFNNLELRSDVGALWENFLVIERLKLRKYDRISASQFFWRTYDGAEIDLVEQREGKLFGYEFKWKKERTSPTSWLDYPNASLEVINKDNFWEFLVSPNSQ